jgi:ABC-type antimicrobial peptide transport system permease subunit
MLNAVRATAQAIDPDLPLFNVRTFERALSDAAGAQRAASSMLGVFGVLALVLAAVGMFSVTAHGVALRTREIGIRMSLGARAGDVRALFVREGMVRTLAGVGAGLAGSLAISKVLGGFLFGLAATDVLTFASGALVLCAVAATASYIPARRASRVDPMEALRVE